MLSIGPGGIAGFLDGSVHSLWTMDWFTFFGLVGSFVNSAFSVDPHWTRCINAHYEHPECTPFKFPYSRCGAIQKRSFVVADLDIADGAEVLVDYGTAYNTRHFGGLLIGPE
jgi:hypothetical protein